MTFISFPILRCLHRFDVLLLMLALKLIGLLSLYFAIKNLLAVFIHLQLGHNYLQMEREGGTKIMYVYSYYSCTFEGWMPI